jgi:hypothetical protein
LDANGDEFVYSRFRNRTNPYFAAYNRFENIRRDRVFGNITARYNFTDWLYMQGRIGQDFFARDQDYNIPTGMALWVLHQQGLYLVFMLNKPAVSAKQTMTSYSEQAVILEGLV